jgi:hypothetical protein
VEATKPKRRKEEKKKSAKPEEQEGMPQHPVESTSNKKGGKKGMQKSRSPRSKEQGGRQPPSCTTLLHGITKIGTEGSALMRNHRKTRHTPVQTPSYGCNFKTSKSESPPHPSLENFEQPLKCRVINQLNRHWSQSTPIYPQGRGGNMHM